MPTLATWSLVVQSRDVNPYNFDGLAISGRSLCEHKQPNGLYFTILCKSLSL